MINKIGKILLYLFVFYLPINLSFGETVLETELKEEVKKRGIEIGIEIIQNKETKLQDLYIIPYGDRNYSTGSFIYAVSEGVATITSKSFAYRLYTGMVIIDVNEELWAISSENCREIFKLKTVDEQNTLLQKSLKRLR